MPLIETVHLKKYFDTGSGLLHAVDDVNLTIQPRKTLGVVGESGCGKSTLGRTILRLTPATEGKILYNGKDILTYNPHQLRQLRREMQIIFQDPYSSLNPRMTVSELIAEPLVVNKVMKNRNQLKERVKELMETVGLAARLENAYPHELDGGRRQRIGVARALSVNPKFIVCDEPVSALDVSIQAQILNLLMDLQDDMGLTYMFITHDLSVVRHISDEIAVMYLGQCVERCGSKELFDNPLHPYTKALLDAIQVPDISLRGKKKAVIRGEVTSPIDPEPGCRFAARCPHAADACRGGQIPLREVSPGHYAACNLI
ncbi:ATP-binding cassette domain-containing protein [Enterocloster aldenensis]|nr:ATP-binding cassette domain-containing protein [Enterocloster aldenensis]RGC62173.1 ATP-binding cassette domain-containing protein [Dorea longicatena]